MKEIFVSYSHTDTASVESIVRRLSGRGYGVWWDQRLHGGEDFTEVIESALNTSKCAVVAWSKSARRSLWVRAEANSAREGGKLVQLTLDGTKPPLPFSMLHTLDFKQDNGLPDTPPMQELQASVESVISGKQVDVSTVPQARLAGFEPVAVAGGASIGLIVLASALVGLGPGMFSANKFGLACYAMFLTALLVFAGMLVHLILTYMASRQR